ncbi:unnamed protein product [Hymenolepis diminuta]|uniref:Nucleotide-diphospho-sugar transferase domain-containing protein n=1 Tax=Hymenolepis diminuta TaxID=6216 RepID=A0A564XZB4_HYMDI|nr:unnamed protein product [Hymenolepis diminuta]VUZ39593.1 unnamed protein product [Hymenolepis diminuta]VUZ48072.1 unnamed protein product [Hymenolepis diminuta]
MQQKVARHYAFPKLGRHSKFLLLLIISALVICAFYERATFPKSWIYDCNTDVNFSKNVYEPLEIDLLHLKASQNTLKSVDEKMNDTDPQAIHVMQTVMSSGTVRFHVIFLKSLILHHFERGGPNAAPIHLHLLTDKASGYILEGILGSWRINKLRYTFYSAEPYYARVSWMKSNHYSGKVSTMKLYIPEILNSTVSKVILFDTDCLFMTDIVHLWNHFDHFKPLQFLGMAPEPFNVYYDLTEFGGGKQSFSYNGGVIMWNLQRLTMKKWEALYKPAYERALKVFTRLTAAEQTLMTVVIMENPEILYRLSCHWNFQLYEGVIPEECPSTWNRPPAPDLLDPLILHGDRYDKRELDFSLNEPKTLANHGRPNRVITC